LLNNHTPKVTIITATYNAEQYLSQTIESVLEQGYENLEYIIVDGGSTDKTLSIIASYKSQITKVISEPDTGIYNAWNKGIRLASGDIIGFLSADDWYGSSAIADAVYQYNERLSEYWVFYGDMLRVEANGATFRQKDSDITFINRRMSVSHPTVFVATSIYRRRIFDENFKISGDYEYFLYLAGLQDVVFCKTNNVLAFMRDGGVSDRYSSILKVIIEDNNARKQHLPLLESQLYFLLDICIKLPKKTVKYILGKLMSVS
jgi:glycosyltransferase involved in cell wall biosynthesis